MPRDIPVGNGNLLVSFDKEYLLRDLYYPHVGEENHARLAPFRFGVWVNGRFSWIPNGWRISLQYLDESLVTHALLENDGLSLRIEANDCVDFHENIYLKKIVVENLSDEEQDVRLFLSHDFYIYGNAVGDTAAFRPEVNGLLHYKGERYFLVNVFANNKYGIDHYATGNKEISSFEGTWKDAEDGVLSGNPIAQGSVDSIVGIPLRLKPKSKDTCYYWIVAGQNWNEVKSLQEVVKRKTPEVILKRTLDYWKLWVSKNHHDIAKLPKKLSWLYTKSLLICRTQINNCGSIIAANDSDVVLFNRDTYSYMWPRDGALVAYGLDLAGYRLTANFYTFCAKIIEKDGFFLHKYTPSGSLASSWHPWVVDKRPQLPIQEDETALVIWALWNHYRVYKDVEFIKPLYRPLIKRAADFLMNYRDLKTGLPLPSYDLWEERQGVLTFTVAAVHGGLMAASHFTQAFGETALAHEYREGARRMREAMDTYLFLPNENRFARLIRYGRDGTIEVDATVDASLYAVFAFGAYRPDDERVQSTMEQIRERLSVAGGGLCRYENDSYYREKESSSGNPWFVTTLWLAQYYIARAKSKAELDQALPLLEWVAERALPSGVLAEQVNPRTNEPLSVSPLTWSHGTYIATVHEYLNKLSELETCPTCGRVQKVGY